jgi:hypothetical protein
MPMEVAVDGHPILSLQRGEKLLEVVDGRVEPLHRAVPLPVQVDTRQRAPVVAVDHPVGIQHGDDFKFEMVSQGLGFHRLSRQKIDDAFRHPTEQQPVTDTRKQNVHFETVEA